MENEYNSILNGKNDNFAELESSANARAVITTGYCAVVIKYLADDGKYYAIKRVRSDKEVKHFSSNPIAQFKQEADIYNRLKYFPNIPKVYEVKYNENVPENNCLVMDWIEGEPASDDGNIYSFDLVNKRNLVKIYQDLLALDKSGVLHGDLWAANILLTKESAAIIDFNRGRLVNPADIDECNADRNNSNVANFHYRFLDRFLTDVYDRQGCDALLDFYGFCMKCERDFYKGKGLFFMSENKTDAFNVVFHKYCVVLDILNDEKVLKDSAIKTIFASSLDAAEKYTQYFELEEGEAFLNFARTKKILAENKEALVGVKGADMQTIVLGERLARFVRQGIDAMMQGDNFRCGRNMQMAGLLCLALPKDAQDKIFAGNVKELSGIMLSYIKCMQKKDCAGAADLLNSKDEFFQRNKRLKPLLEKMQQRTGQILLSEQHLFVIKTADTGNGI